jgi:hypothetical protein
LISRLSGIRGERLKPIDGYIRAFFRSRESLELKWAELLRQIEQLKAEEAAGASKDDPR